MLLSATGADVVRVIEPNGMTCSTPNLIQLGAWIYKRLANEWTGTRRLGSHPSSSVSTGPHTHNAPLVVREGTGLSIRQDGFESRTARHARVAQLVEQAIDNRQVGGSKPPMCTTFL